MLTLHTLSAIVVNMQKKLHEENRQQATTVEAPKNSVSHQDNAQKAIAKSLRALQGDLDNKEDQQIIFEYGISLLPFAY